jgi:hypothetical protein
MWADCGLSERSSVTRCDSHQFTEDKFLNLGKVIVSVSIVWIASAQVAYIRSLSDFSPDRMETLWNCLKSLTAAMRRHRETTDKHSVASLCFAVHPVLFVHSCCFEASCRSACNDDHWEGGGWLGKTKLCYNVLCIVRVTQLVWVTHRSVGTPLLLCCAVAVLCCP